MRRAIINLHNLLMRIAVGGALVMLVLSLTVFVKDAGSSRFDLFDTVSASVYTAACAIFVALHCHPALRFRAVVAPARMRHIPISMLVGFLGLTFVVESALLGFRALQPLSVNIYLAWPYLTLGTFAAIVLMTLAGIARAFLVRNQPPEAAPCNAASLARCQNIARIASVCVTVAIPVTIIASIRLGGYPSATDTMVNVIILAFCAVAIRRQTQPRPDMNRRTRIWDSLPSLLSALIAIYILQRVVLAFLNHATRFRLPQTIDIYPGVETLLMLPLILFVLSGSALWFARPKVVADRKIVAEVFV